MSRPRAPMPAKLIVGFFVKERALASGVAQDLQAHLGGIEMVSPWFDFDFTTYYAAEMGSPLSRRLVVFKPLVAQTQLAAVKRGTNALERKYQVGGRRRVNIDPGYLLPERFVLATGKNFSHRIYVGGGIYADLTLIFRKGAFRCLPWTYPDYADHRLIDFLLLARRRYRLQLQAGGGRGGPV